MKIRDCLCSSVLPLCILSFVSFILIFFVTALYTFKNNNQIMEQLPLKMQNIPQWGQIPGSLNYTYTKNFTLFNLTGISSSTDIESVQLNLTSIPSITFNITRDFTNIVLDEHTKNINYTIDT